MNSFCVKVILFDLMVKVLSERNLIIQKSLRDLIHSEQEVSVNDQKEILPRLRIAPKALQYMVDVLTDYIEDQIKKFKRNLQDSGKETNIRKSILKTITLEQLRNSDFPRLKCQTPEQILGGNCRNDGELNE